MTATIRSEGDDDHEGAIREGKAMTTEGSEEDQG